MMRIGKRQGQVNVMPFAMSVRFSLGQAAPAHSWGPLARQKAALAGTPRRRRQCQRRVGACPRVRAGPRPRAGATKPPSLMPAPGDCPARGDRDLHAACAAARSAALANEAPWPRPGIAEALVCGLAVRNPSHNGTHFSKEGGNGGGSASHAARYLNRAHTTKASVG